MNAPALLDAVLAIAVKAGDCILKIYKSDYAIAHKDDNSPLTEADLAAHACIVEGLEALADRYPVLSEEDADIPYATRKTWSRYWLVDPLDGTKEFIKRNGEFTVNIALVEDGFPVLGVVHAPALGITYLGGVGLGAFRIENGVKAPMRTRKVPATPALVVSRSHKDAALEAFLSKAPPHEAVSKGSSLKFCQVAEGSADLYPRTGPTSEWDTGAGQCVAEAAGGKVVRLPGQTRLRYNEKESILNPLFAVIGDPSYDWAPLLATIA